MISAPEPKHTGAAFEQAQSACSGLRLGRSPAARWAANAAPVCLGSGAEIISRRLSRFLPVLAGMAFVIKKIKYLIDLLAQNNYNKTHKQYFPAFQAVLVGIIK